LQTATIELQQEAEYPFCDNSVADCTDQDNEKISVKKAKHGKAFFLQKPKGRHVVSGREAMRIRRSNKPIAVTILLTSTKWFVGSYRGESTNPSRHTSED